MKNFDANTNREDDVCMGKHRELAREFVSALKELVNNEKAIDNFEGYLAWHFPAWLEKWAKTPEDITDEMEHFAHIYD